MDEIKFKELFSGYVERGREGDWEGEVEADGGEEGEGDEWRMGEVGRERRCCRGDRREG